MLNSYDYFCSNYESPYTQQRIQKSLPSVYQPGSMFQSEYADIFTPTSPQEIVPSRERSELFQDMSRKYGDDDTKHLNTFRIDSNGQLIYTNKYLNDPSKYSGPIIQYGYDLHDKEQLMPTKEFCYMEEPGDHCMKENPCQTCANNHQNNRENRCPGQCFGHCHENICSCCEKNTCETKKICGLGHNKCSNDSYYTYNNKSILKSPPHQSYQPLINSEYPPNFVQNVEEYGGMNIFMWIIVALVIFVVMMLIIYCSCKYFCKKNKENIDPKFINYSHPSIE